MLYRTKIITSVKSWWDTQYIYIIYIQTHEKKLTTKFSVFIIVIKFLTIINFIV